MHTHRYGGRSPLIPSNHTHTLPKKWCALNERQRHFNRIAVRHILSSHPKRLRGRSTTDIPFSSTSGLGRRVSRKADHCAANGSYWDEPLFCSNLRLRL